MTDSPVSPDGGNLSTIDLLLPNYVEIPTGEPGFDSLRIRITMTHPEGHGTNYQRVYSFKWLTYRIRTPAQLLTFLHREAEAILRLLAAHLEAQPDEIWRISLLIFATGGLPEDDSWSQMRSCGAVDWIGKVPVL